MNENKFGCGKRSFYKQKIGEIVWIFEENRFIIIRDEVDLSTEITKEWHRVVRHRIAIFFLFEQIDVFLGKICTDRKLINASIGNALLSEKIIDLLVGLLVPLVQMVLE